MALVESPTVRLHQAENLSNVVAVLQNLTEFPGRYIWSAPERDNSNHLQDPNVTDDEANLQVPLIDLSGLLSADPTTKEKIVRQIGYSCEKVGIVQVVNHGISDMIFNEAAVQGRKFFALPVEEKEKGSDGQASVYAGYSGRFPAVNSHTPWLETVSGFNSGMEASMPSSTSLWPEDNPVNCKALEEFFDKLRAIGIEVLEALALHLGIEQSTFSQQFKSPEDHRSQWRLNYYPKSPRPDLTVGAGPHTDPNILTLLMADCDGSLQVQRGDRWFDVPHIASSRTIVINVGDTLEAWSNGRLKSVIHRVLSDEKSDRLSTVYAMSPLPFSIIEAPSQLIDPEHPSLYKPFTYREYMDNIKRSVRIRGKSALKNVLRETQ